MDESKNSPSLRKVSVHLWFILIRAVSLCFTLLTHSHYWRGVQLWRIERLLIIFGAQSFLWDTEFHLLTPISLLATDWKQTFCGFILMDYFLSLKNQFILLHPWEGSLGICRETKAVCSIHMYLCPHKKDLAGHYEVEMLIIETAGINDIVINGLLFLWFFLWVVVLWQGYGVLGWDQPVACL